MTGIVNSTGARSGVIGTTVGTPGGGWQLLHTRTGTASDFHMGYDSGTKFTADYNFYMVHISNWYETGTTGHNEPRLRVLDSNNVEDSSSVYEYEVEYTRASAYDGTHGSGVDHIRMGHTIHSGSGGYTIQVFFANPLGTTHYKHINFLGEGTDESGYLRCCRGSGIWKSTAAIYGINFHARYGDTIGTFRLYGLGIS